MAGKKTPIGDLAAVAETRDKLKTLAIQVEAMRVSLGAVGAKKFKIKGSLGVLRALSVIEKWIEAGAAVASKAEQRRDEFGFELATGDSVSAVTARGRK